MFYLYLAIALCIWLPVLAVTLIKHGFSRVTQACMLSSTSLCLSGLIWLYNPPANLYFGLLSILGITCIAFMLAIKLKMKWESEGYFG